MAFVSSMSGVSMSTNTCMTSLGNSTNKCTNGAVKLGMFPKRLRSTTSFQAPTSPLLENKQCSTTISMSGQGGRPPINAPSSVLLLSSSVLAISTVGCVFELTSGHPTYGTNLTSAILAMSAPGFLFLFYAAIRKGQQEAMDDP